MFYGHHHHHHFHPGRMWRRGMGWYGPGYGPWGHHYYRRGCGCCLPFALPFLLLPFAAVALMVFKVL